MDIFVRQALADHRLHRFRLRSFLGRQPGAIQHVQEIGVAAGIQLIRALDFHSALAEKIDNRSMQDCRAHLRFNVVADEGRFLSAKRFAQTGSLAIKTGMLLTKPSPASNAQLA